MKENNTPLISVMVLAYNHAPYLRQAIESVLMQECSYDYEIVISDDYSTDDTRLVCLELQKEHPEKIRLILNEKNKGVIENYFDTMSLCKGKYIADCSGDDYWISSTKLQKQVDILEQNDDVVLVHTNWKNYLQSRNIFVNDVKSVPPNYKQQLLDERDIPAFINQKNFSIVSINTCCYRREVGLRIYTEYSKYFDRNRYICEDFQLLLFLLTKGCFYYMDEEATVYRVLDESVSQSLDFSKQFKYRYSQTIQRADLAKEFDVSLNKYLSIESVDLFYLAFKAKRPDLAKQAMQLLKELDYKLPVKAKLIYYIARSPFLTDSAYVCYLVLRKLKRLLK